MQANAMLGFSPPDRPRTVSASAQIRKADCLYRPAENGVIKSINPRKIYKEVVTNVRSCIATAVRPKAPVVRLNKANGSHEAEVSSIDLLAMRRPSLKATTCQSSLETEKLLSPSPKVQKRISPVVSTPLRSPTAFQGVRVIKHVQNVSKADIPVPKNDATTNQNHGINNNQRTPLSTQPHVTLRHKRLSQSPGSNMTYRDAVKLEMPENKSKLNNPESLPRCSVVLQQIPSSAFKEPQVIGWNDISSTSVKVQKEDSKQYNGGSSSPSNVGPSPRKLRRVSGANMCDSNQINGGTSIRESSNLDKSRDDPTTTKKKPTGTATAIFLNKSFSESKQGGNGWMNNNNLPSRVTRQAMKANGRDGSNFFRSEKPQRIFRDSESDEELQKAIAASKELADNLNKLDAETAKMPIPASGIPLTETMLQEVKTQFGKPANTKIVTKFRLTIKQDHLALFNENEWLEDPNIDFYLEMIKDRNERMKSAGYPKIYIFHSFLFKLCQKNEFEAVKEFTNENIFEYDLAFFPILIKDHWRLIVADFRKKTLFCYDSLFRVNDNYLRIITKYLEQEYKLKVEQQGTWSSVPPLPDIPQNSATMSPESEPESTESCSISEADTLPLYIPEDEAPRKVRRLKTPFPPSWETYFRDWDIDTLDPIQTPLPQQKNGYDCGIFLCQYAESLARGVEPPFDFSQVNMLYFRYLMAYETIHGELVDRRSHHLPLNYPESPPT